MTRQDKPSSTDAIRHDADGQFVQSQEGRRNSGVSSAKPTVITGSEDATAHKAPPGKQMPADEWDLNFDEGEHPTGKD